MAIPVSESPNKFINYLRKEGYKVTPQRLEIFKIVKSSKKHLTAEDIYQEIKRKNPTISPATVYKTLELLEKIGEVQPICQMNGKTVYDSNTDPHVNLICINCNKIEDIKSDEIEKIIKEIEKKTRSEIVAHSINFYTKCSECMN